LGQVAGPGSKQKRRLRIQSTVPSHNRWRNEKQDQQHPCIAPKLSPNRHLSLAKEIRHNEKDWEEHGKKNRQVS
jgi:hypothetical protein